MPSAGSHSDHHLSGLSKLASRARAHLRATKTIREEDANEASPSPISAWGRGRCRAPCPFAGRISRNISVAAGALHRFFCGGRSQRHRRAHRRPIPVGSSGAAICHENRAGAAGNVGMQSALNSAPDGYTIAFARPNYAINPGLYEKLPFDFIRDSVPVAGIMRLANVMDVNPTFPADNLAEFIDYSKANPGKINFASGGVGTSPHLSGELLNTMAGI